jgi:hypothetical protein
MQKPLVGWIGPELGGVHLVVVKPSDFNKRTKQLHFDPLTALKAAVMAKQWVGVISGRTPKVVSPTRPREADVIASALTGHPRRTRSINPSHVSKMEQTSPHHTPRRTFDEHTIDSSQQGPKVGL